MKFKSLKLHNFMRYRGDVEVHFSCDKNKNVTVILGDNTFGKTTLAQAFRWGLFEELASTNYAKKGEIVLLNHEVINAMTTTTQHSQVTVETVIEDGEDTVLFRRTGTFRRKSTDADNLNIIQVGESSLIMQITRNGVPGLVINNNGVNGDKTMKKGCVQDKINSMLPSYLSNYFFFDGERWSNSKASKSEIKQAIETILGVTGFVALKNHLKDSPYNARKLLANKLQIGDTTYDGIQEELEALNDKLERLIHQEEEATEFVNSAKELVALRQNKLDEHKGDEDNIVEYNRAERRIARAEDAMQGYYNDAVKRYADSARYLAAGMLPRVVELFDQIDLNGKDIPGVTTDTVDYLLNEGKCICDTILEEESEAYKALLTLRKQIPPEMIGGAAGKLKDLLEGWLSDSENLLTDLKDKQCRYDDENDEKMDAQGDRDKASRRMNRNVDVKALRSQLREANERLISRTATQRNIIAEIEAARNAIDEKVKHLETLASQNEHNTKVKLAIAYLDEIYDIAVRYSKKAQDNILEDLNSIISKNFDVMFHDAEKYAKLEDDYKVHIYYQSTDIEETVLSNGEATAVNFVYIVSILELARQRAVSEKEEPTDEDDVSGILHLPLVLDGPFSSLSNVNTNLVANKLPRFAEQLIIFMMDKDWEASGLDAFTEDTFCYHINKEAKAVSSTIELKGGAM